MQVIKLHGKTLQGQSLWPTSVFELGCTSKVMMAIVWPSLPAVVISTQLARQKA